MKLNYFYNSIKFFSNKLDNNFNIEMSIFCEYFGVISVVKKIVYLFVLAILTRTSSRQTIT